MSTNVPHSLHLFYPENAKLLFLLATALLPAANSVMFITVDLPVSLIVIVGLVLVVSSNILIFFAIFHKMNELICLSREDEKKSYEYKVVKKYLSIFLMHLKIS